MLQTKNEKKENRGKKRRKTHQAQKGAGKERKSRHEDEMKSKEKQD